MSHVFRFSLIERPGAEFTMIDAESKSVHEARDVLDWQFSGRVLDVWQMEASTSGAPHKRRSPGEQDRGFGSFNSTAMESFNDR